MTGHGYYGSCLPKDSSELKGLEAEYGLTSRLYAEVVNVNDEVVSIDKKEKRGEILEGDFHKPPSALME
jgi:UDP-glucose 6-dehydrogenase